MTDLGNLGLRPADAYVVVKTVEDKPGASTMLDTLVRLALRKAVK